MHFCLTLQPSEQNWISTASQITDRHLCAGYQSGGQDGCDGDSGGGLVYVDRDSDKYVLAGVMSAGHGCGRPKSPGIYTRDSIQ